MENAREAVPGWLAAALGKQDPQMLSLVENFPAVAPYKEIHLDPLATSCAAPGMVTLQTSSRLDSKPHQKWKLSSYSFPRSAWLNWQPNSATDFAQRGMERYAIWLQHRLHFRNRKVGHHTATREKKACRRVVFDLWRSGTWEMWFSLPLSVWPFLWPLSQPHSVPSEQKSGKKPFLLAVLAAKCSQVFT